MRHIYLFLAFLLLALPAQAAERPITAHGMHDSDPAYSEQAFLSGMIAHHEGAVAMSEALLRAPENRQDPQVAAWAREIIKAQKSEIEEMKGRLKDVGGLDQKAYDQMHREMQAMMHVYTSKDPNVQFVQQMLPHHGMAVIMTVPVLVHSQHEALLKLAQEISVSQADEMHAFRTWLNARGDHTRAVYH